jgi:hypothetical protein
MSNFTKAGSEHWQSTLTRAPLFANLFFDRLAALGSRAVNPPFRGLCFVALFDQVVDCRLLACVPSVDTPWRCGGHSHSPRPVAAFSAFSSGQVRRLDWKGRPFHRGYRKRPRRLLNRLRPLRFLSYRRVAWRLRLSGLTSHCSTPVSVQMRPSITKDPRATRSISPGCQAGVPMKLRFALGNICRAKSWTMRSVADAKWSATRNSSVASCYQPSSCLVDDNFYLGSVSSAVKCHGKGSCRCRHQCDTTNGTDDSNPSRSVASAAARSPCRAKPSARNPQP